MRRSGFVSRKPRKLFGSIFSSSVSENGEVYTPEISFVKRTSLCISNTKIKQLCNHKLRYFAMTFRVRKPFGTFEKRAPDPDIVQSGHIQFILP